MKRLQAETTPKAMGAKSWREVLAIRWRISPREAGRRLDDAATLAPRQGLTGTPLEPVLPCTAIAQAHGLINREHVRILREAVERVPSAVNATTRGPDRGRPGADRDEGWTQGTHGPKVLNEPTGPCSCSTRTAPHPTTPNASGAAG